MNIAPLLKISWRSLSSSKIRTGLTVLGMVIGVASVIVVFSAGEGIKSLVLGQIESFGTDIIESEIKVPTGKRGTASEVQSATALVQGVQVTTLTLEDMEDIDKLANVKKSYAGIINQEQISYQSEMGKATIFGVTSEFINIDQTKVQTGRFFTDSEDKSLSRVVVLGSEINKKYFGSSDSIGELIKIGKSKFRVIGVMEERGAVMGTNFDEYIYMPLRTLQKRIMGIDHVLMIIHQLNDVKLADATAAEAREVLRQNHDILDPDKDDFRVVTMIEAMETLSTVTDAITLLLLAIVAISLIVGGVGIMNIMYVIVSERAREIGLRKAVGATYQDIISQFLIESILITLLGGIAGIVIGVLISILIAFGAKYSGLDWELALPLRSFVVAIGFSAFFGIVFGVYPARKAARLTPIEALRQE